MYVLEQSIFMDDHASGSLDSLLCLIQHTVWGILVVRNDDRLLRHGCAESDCDERKNRKYRDLHVLYSIFCMRCSVQWIM